MPPKPWSLRRALAGGLALAVVLAGCSGRTYGSGDLDEVETGIKRPRAKHERPARAAKKPSPTPNTRGTIIIKVVDGRGVPRPNVMVEFTSPVKTKQIRVESDAKGLARVTATPGLWSARIPTGCVGNTKVTFGGSASKIGVVTDETTPGTLKMEGTRRYMPGAPMKWVTEPPWGIGRDIDVRFKLRDTCDDSAVPNITFDGHLLAETEGALAMTSFSTSSDADAWVKVRLNCKHAGDGSVWFYDRWNESDRVDVLTFTPPVDPNARWCGGAS